MNFFLSFSKSLILSDDIVHLCIFYRGIKILDFLGTWP